MSVSYTHLYVSALTLDFLNIRKSGVEAIIYTVGVGQGMQRLMEMCIRDRGVYESPRSSSHAGLRDKMSRTCGHTHEKTDGFFSQN